MLPETIFKDCHTGAVVVRFSDSDIALRVGNVWDDKYIKTYRRFNCSRFWIYARDGTDALDGFLRTQLSSSLQLMGGFTNARLIEQAAFLNNLTVQFTNRTRLDLSKLRLREFYGSVATVTDMNHLPTSLITIGLRGYKGYDLTAFEYLTNLESLTLNLARNLGSLKGIGAFPDLRTLTIWSAPHLADLELLTRLTKLEELRLEHVKGFDDISYLGKLPLLRILDLSSCGKLPSLKVLRDLPSLEELLFIEDTNIEDGAILQLGEIPTLRKVRFKNRHHYDVTREELREVLDKH